MAIINYLKDNPIIFLVLCVTTLALVWRGIFYVNESYGFFAGLLCFIVSFSIISPGSKRLAKIYKKTSSNKYRAK